MSNDKLPAAAVSQPPCKECGGTRWKHYTGCSIWIGDGISARRLHDEYAMAALTGMLAGGMAYDDRTILGAFSVADRCLAIRHDWHPDRYTSLRDLPDGETPQAKL